jgi:hypothetical protein
MLPINPGLALIMLMICAGALFMAECAWSALRKDWYLAAGDGLFSVLLIVTAIVLAVSR